MASTLALSFVLLFCFSLASAQNFLDLSDAEILGLKLKTSLTEVNREALLNNSQYIFDFAEFATQANATGVTSGQGGKTVAALPTNFPALIGHGMAMTVGYIEPCGINLPHTHPRATEINFILSGSFRVGFFQENNAHFVGNTLSAGQMTVFPQGAIHFEQNLGCTPAVFVAAFNNEDPGVQTTTSTYFGLPSDIAGVGLGLSAAQIQALAVDLAKNPALGVLECRQLCGIDTNTTSNSTGFPPSTNSSSSNTTSTNSSAPLSCVSSVSLAGPVSTWNDSLHHYEQFAVTTFNSGAAISHTATIALNISEGAVFAQWNMVREHFNEQFNIWQVTLYDLAPGRAFSQAGFIWSISLDQFSQLDSDPVSLQYLTTQC